MTSKHRWLGASLAVAIVALLHGAIAQYANDPFFEHTEELAFAYGAEMIGIRLDALTALGDPPEDFLEETEKTLTRDLPRFRGSLEAQDASLAEQLEAALGEVLETQDEDAIARARDLSRQAQDLLVPAELQQDPSFVAALMAKLLLADDGVAEGYEDAAEGDIWEYPNGWAALQRVKEMWEGLRPVVSDDIEFEIDDMLDFIDELFPSPVPPDEFRGDPEEAEAPAHRIVGFLEDSTDAFLYPGRDLGQLAGLTHRLVQGGCEAYTGGQALIGRERTVAANFYYHHYLRRLLDLLAPELHENAVELFSQLLAEDAEPEAATAQCQELLETLGEAQEMLGG